MTQFKNRKSFEFVLRPYTVVHTRNVYDAPDGVPAFNRVVFLKWFKHTKTFVVYSQLFISTRHVYVK